MGSVESTRRWRFAVALLVLALVAMACTESGDDGASDATEPADDGEPTCVERLLFDEDGLVESGGADDSVQFAASLCERLGGSEVGALRVVVCADGAPQLVDGETGELLFWSHRIFRFHPADAIEPVGPDAFDPADALALFESELDVEGWDREPSIVVIDEEGDHLRHVVGVIEAVFAAAGAQPAITEVELPAGFATETDIVDALRPYTDDSDGDGPLLVNLSFGTYTCDDVPPPELERALTDVVDKNEERGVHVFASAGNDETERPSWPGAFGVTQGLQEHVTSVGSVMTDTSTDVIRSCFSNYGPPVEIWMKGEKVAVGDDQWSGTSFAAPQALALYGLGFRDVPSGAGPLKPTVDPTALTITWKVGSRSFSATSFCPSGDYEPSLPDLDYS